VHFSSTLHSSISILIDNNLYMNINK